MLENSPVFINIESKTTDVVVITPPADNPVVEINSFVNIERTDIEVVAVGPIWVQTGGAAAATITFTAGQVLSGHRVVTTNGAGQAIYADVANAAHVNGVVGLTTNAALLGGDVTVVDSGQVSEPSWNWSTNLPIYLTGMGQLTQTLPTTGFALQIAVPTSATSVIVAIKMPIFLI